MDPNDPIPAHINGIPWPKATEFTPSGKPRWRNEKLPAGAPLYYYCTVCGEESDRLIEGHDPRIIPKVVHDHCQDATGGK